MASRAPATGMNIPAVSAGVSAMLQSGGTESVQFLNDLVGQMWNYVNVAGSKMVKDTVEPMFKEMLPGPLKTLHFNKIDLGRVPFMFDNVDVHSVGDDTIKMDIDVKWDGEMDVELDADYMPGFGVQHIKFYGRLSVLLRPLIGALPLISAAQISFINPPKIELDFTGAAQVADLSVVDKAIRGVINSVIASLLVLPNRLLIKLDPIADYYRVYFPPLGFIRVTVESGAGFQATGTLVKDLPDAYCMVKVGGTEAWKTKTIKNDATPQWNEKHDFLLCDLDQEIVVEVYEEDIGSDAYLGIASITVGKLLDTGNRSQLPLVLTGTKDSAASIVISAEVLELTSSAESLRLESESDGVYSGILTILISDAKDVPGKKEEMSLQVTVECNGQTFKTGVVADAPGIDANNPRFDSAFRVPLTSKNVAASPDIKISLLNKNEPVGSVVIPFNDIVNAPDLTIDAERAMERGGSLRAKVMIQGVSG